MSETTRNWKWYCGGSVIGIAVVLGCATAVDFKSSGREAGSAPVAESPKAGAHKTKRGVAAEPGHEHGHNGGKVRMPVSASFDGDGSVTLSRDRDVTISISADADIQNVQGNVEGIDGLEGQVNQPLGFATIAGGETKLVNVFVPAKTGALVVRIAGVVGGMPMAASLELKVVNPKDVKASSAGKPKPADMALPVSKDAMGLVVQPMRAAE